LWVERIWPSQRGADLAPAVEIHRDCGRKIEQLMASMADSQRTIVRESGAATEK